MKKFHVRDPEEKAVAAESKGSEPVEVQSVLKAILENQK
jgi:hypothetical protein